MRVRERAGGVGGEAGAEVHVRRDLRHASAVRARARARVRSAALARRARRLAAARLRPARLRHLLHTRLH